MNRRRFIHLGAASADGQPLLRVVPDAKTLPVARCEIFYSVDADPRARFWRSTEVVRDGDAFTAKLPLHTLELPLFAFANVYFTLPEPVSLKLLPGHGEPVREVCLSSTLHRIEPKQLSEASLATTAKPSALIDDFAHGLRDWYVLNAGNLTHQQMWTRKITDPLWRGTDGAKLALTLKLPQTNRLHFVLQQNEWRSYRGQRKTFVCTCEIPGADAPQTIALELKDFTSPDGSPASWAELDQLGLCANFNTPASEAPLWKGPAPEFLRVAWQ